MEKGQLRMRGKVREEKCEDRKMRARKRGKGKDGNDTNERHEKSERRERQG